MGKYKTFFAFVLGAAAGSAVTWYFVKDFYEKRAQEDIESVKEHAYFNRETSDDSNTEESEEEIQEYVARNSNKPNVVEYAKIIKDSGYSYGPTEHEEEKEDLKNPYVISPDEFGEAGYDEVSYKWYADHILADENDQVVEDIEQVVGFESLTHFGDYEEDSVFVRDDRLKIDYEILQDPRSYYDDILPSKPYLRR